MNNATATNAEGSDGQSNQPSPVLGITIFWILLTLCIVSSWHPLGSSSGFPSKIRRHIRILPLTVLFDSVLLYWEFVHCLVHDRQNRSARDLARQVAIRRLRTNTVVPEKIKHGDGVEMLPLGGVIRRVTSAEEGTNANPSNTARWWLRAVVLFIGLDLRPRILSNILVLFLYTKIHAFQNTPFSMAIATVYFASWIGNEIFLFALYGVVWVRNFNLQHLFDLIDHEDGDDGHGIHRGDDSDGLRRLHVEDEEANPLPPCRPTKPARGLQGSRFVTLTNWILLAVQVTGLVAFAIWVMVSRFQPPGSSSPTTPPTPPQPVPLPQPDPTVPSESSSSWIMAIINFGFSIVKWLATPSIWWFDHVGEPLLLSDGYWRLHYFPPFMVMAFVFTVGLPCLILGIPAIIVSMALVTSPLWMAFLAFLAFLHIAENGVGGGVNFLVGILVLMGWVVWKSLRVVFSAVTAVMWAWGGSLLLLSATLVYYTVFWDSSGTSKAPWGEWLG